MYTDKTILFVAHDPGGFDVINPVAGCFIDNYPSVQYYCVGPAAKLNPAFAAGKEIVETRVIEMLHNGDLAMLMTGTSWGSDFELKLVELGNAWGIATAVILDYWTNYSLRLTDNGKTVYPRYYIVMDELARKEAAAEGIPDQILFVLGHPGLDKYRQKKKEAQQDLKKSVIALSQPLSKLYGNSLGYSEEGVLHDVVRACQALEKTIHIKFHPKDDKSLMEKFLPFMVDGALDDLIVQYETVVGMNSMGLLHASMLGAKVISYQPDLKEPDLCITNKLGLTRNCNNYEELVKGLSEPAAEFSGLNSSTESFIWMDGRSAERVVRFLEGVIRNEY